MRRTGELLEACKARRVRLATAESCTGGLIAACLTELPGSSAVFDRGFVTYGNTAKSDLLGVPHALFLEAGAVSEAVARAMAEGALARADATLAVSCTGIAGPEGGSAAKPVGTVHLACAVSGRPTAHRLRSYGDIGRTEIRLATVADAIALALDMLDA